MPFPQAQLGAATVRVDGGPPAPISLDDTGGFITLQQEIHTAARSVSFDPDLFVSGHFYDLEIAPQIGLPGVATGHFVTVTYPYSLAISWTGMFEIVAP